MQARLIIGYVVLVSLLLTAVGLWTTQYIRMELSNVENKVRSERLHGAAQLLNATYQSEEHLSHLQSIVETIAIAAVQRVILIDPSGAVIADSHSRFVSMDPTTLPDPNWQSNVDPNSWTTFRMDESRMGYIIFGSTDYEDLPSFDHSFMHPEPSVGTSSGYATLAEIVHSTSLSPNDPPDGRSADVGPNADAYSNGTSLLPVPWTAKLRQETAETPTYEASMQLVGNHRRSLVLSGIAAAVVGLFLIVFYVRRAFRPVHKVVKVAERFGKGEFEQRVETGYHGQLGKLATTFNSMADDIQSAESRRRQLSADIAHELRTPLANIRGYLEAINDRILPPNPETIETVHKETVHLSALVDDLRLIASSDAGALVLELKPDQLECLVASVVQACKQRAQEMDVEIHCFFDNPLPLVDLNRTRMAQIVENLIANALNHSEPQGVINVRIENPYQSPFVLLSVEDNGTGIAKKDLKRIFERFYRTDSSRTRSTGGAGLGLTIVRRLVETHGGEISVESKLGQGTTFTIQLPRSKTTATTG